MFVTLKKLSRVFVTVGELEYSPPSALPLHIVTLIHVSALELVDATSVLNVIHPLTDINVAVGIFESAFPRSLIVLPFAVVA